MNTRIALMFQGSSTPQAIVEDYASDLESQWNDGYRVGAVESLG